MYMDIHAFMDMHTCMYVCIYRKTSALLTMPKPLTVWITQTVENSSRDGNARPSDLLPEKFVCGSRSDS